MKNKTLLTIKDAVEYLNVSKVTLQRWDNSGKLKAIRTKGGHRRYKLSDLEKFLEEKPSEYDYGTLYETLCESQYQADMLNMEGLVEKRICDELLMIREAIGEKLLKEHFEKAVGKQKEPIEEECSQ